MAATLRVPVPGDAVSPRSVRGTARPIIVMSRGDDASDGAILVARQMAARNGSGIHLVGVLEPARIVAPELGVVLDVPDDPAERRAQLERAIAAQLARLGMQPADVDVDIREGDPTTVIVNTARDAAAQVVMLGATHHGVLDRVFGSDTAVRVARSASVPVLVVPRACRALPSSALVAVDFSDASVRAGIAALELFPEVERLDLVHVAPRADTSIDVVAAGEWQDREHGITRAFDQVREALPVPAGVAVTRHVRRGSAARELVRVADERGAALIVAGSHGYGAIHRLLVGSVATALLRSSTVPVLVLPARAGADFHDPRLQAMRDPAFWPRTLDEFSQRNEGRHATLEVDDPVRGARVQDADVAFHGCVYDQRDGRLAIMLGDGLTTSAHYVRGISGVDEISILAGADGRDRVLRVSHGRSGGTTTLVFAG